MAWLGGINPSSVNGPDPRRLRPAREGRERPRKADPVEHAEPPSPVDEFEPSPESRAVREEMERNPGQFHPGLAELQRSAADGERADDPVGDEGAAQQGQAEPAATPLPRLDIQG
jgi:hypothetical protein